VLLFGSLAYASDVHQLLIAMMFLTLILDIVLVRFVITPFARRRGLVRQPWKQRLMDRGLMPAFDIFTIYFVVSLCLVFSSVDLAIWLVAILKTVDWGYRCYEVLRTYTEGLRVASS
jgi:hypothetical protein